jgi:hypothetical protein
VKIVYHNEMRQYIIYSYYPQRAVRRMGNQIKIQVRIEIIILMLWNIWKCRNAWIFDRPGPGGVECAAALAPKVGGAHPPNAFRL